MSAAVAVRNHIVTRTRVGNELVDLCCRTACAGGVDQSTKVVKDSVAVECCATGLRLQAEDAAIVSACCLCSHIPVGHIAVDDTASVYTRHAVVAATCRVVSCNRCEFGGSRCQGGGCCRSRSRNVGHSCRCSCCDSGRSIEWPGSGRGRLDCGGSLAGVSVRVGSSCLYN